MMHPKKMSKIRIVTLKNISDNLIALLHAQGYVDIRKYDVENLNEDTAGASFDELSLQISKLRPAAALIEPYISKKYKDDLSTLTILKTISASETTIEANKLFPTADHLINIQQKLLKLEEQLTNNMLNLKSLNEFSGFENIDFDFLSKSRFLSFRFGKLTDKRKLDALSSVPQVEINRSKENFLLLFPKKISKEIDDILGDKFISTEPPAGITTIKKLSEELQLEQSKIKHEIKNIERNKDEIAQKIYGKLTQVIYNIEIAIERKKIISKFGSSKKLYVIEGWTVTQNLDHLQKTIDTFSPNAYLLNIDFDPLHDVPPTLLENPSFLKPFEYLTKSYSFPNYNDLDPTLAYAIGVPIVYGMMVGDVIYGIISAFIALFFMSKFPKSEIMQVVSKIWFISAIPTILFGLIFNEWAALPLHDLLGRIGIVGVGEYKPLIHRLHDVMPLLLATIILGIVHLTLGFVFGAITEWKHNKKHSVAKVAWIVFMYGIAFALTPPVLGILEKAGHQENATHTEIAAELQPPQYFQYLTLLGLSSVVIGFILIAWTEGIVGILEIPGLFGNLLSYTRIAAIGIVGVVLAEIINRFLFPSGDIVQVIILIPLYILLHVVNCFLAMFESIIQGGRLNILEFKSKFLHGNGNRFDPFSIKR